MPKKQPPPISMRVGQLEFHKLNAAGWEWRDTYHWILSLSWPRFGALVLGVFTAVNLCFAALYVAGGDCIAELPHGSFAQAFFFSVETLATVGYGHMYPVTLYAHLLTTVEIVFGMFWVAVMTGLIFVRFSRPEARVMFSSTIVVAPFDGKLTMMLRVANLRHQAMVETTFRLMLLRNESIAEDDWVRRFYTLKLTFEHLIVFPAALTLRHIIDETSPLHEMMSMEALECGDVRLNASIVGVDTVTLSPVQSQRDYTWRDIRIGSQFVEIYTVQAEGHIQVDYGRLHDIEPVPVRGGGT